MASRAPITGAPTRAPFIPVVSRDTLDAFESAAGEFSNLVASVRAASEALGSDGPSDVQRLLHVSEFIHNHLDQVFSEVIERGYAEMRSLTVDAGGR